jgi:hypothetical protein
MKAIVLIIEEALRVHGYEFTYNKTDDTVMMFVGRGGRSFVLELTESTPAA